MRSPPTPSASPAFSEARTLASLNHPNIAQIYGVEETGSMRALVLELVEGETLEDWLRLQAPGFSWMKRWVSLARDHGRSVPDQPDARRRHADQTF